MPTPARLATSETGADGSATNTARAASRISWSLRAASACRPGSGAAASGLRVMMCTLPDRNVLFCYRPALLAWPMGGGAASAAKIIGQKPLVPQRKTTKVPNERLTARPGLRRECAAARTFGRQAGRQRLHDRRGNDQLSVRRQA